MKNLVNPIPVGSLHIRPNWRYDLLQNPARYKMQDFVSIPESGSGSLKRFLKAGLTYEVHFVVPTYIQEYVNDLPEAEGKMLLRMWKRSFDESGRKKIEVDTNKSLFKLNPVWNLKYVPRITDEFVQRVIYHVSNFKYDPDIQYAIDIYHAEDHQEILRTMGYLIYAGIPDWKLAYRWSISRAKVAAIRQLYFDFSRFPKDRIANFTYLRQLSNVGYFNEVDFMYYKRVYELGELGIKAHLDPTNLTNEERTRVMEFLGQSVISNSLNINLTITNKKDALQYGMVISTLADYYIKQKEATYFDAKIRNLDASTRRTEMGMVEPGEDMSDLDREMIKLLRSQSLQEAPPQEFKTLADLKK